MIPNRATVDDLANAAHLAEVQGRSLWADARSRFFRNRAAVVSFVVLICIFLFSTVGQLIAQFERDFVNFTLIGSNATKGVPSLNVRAFITAFFIGLLVWIGLKVAMMVSTRAESWPRWIIWVVPPAVLLLAFLAQGPLVNDTGHYFGTDSSGRDLFARVVQGTRISLMVGIVGALVAVIVGTLYGAIAGYYGGRVDGVMMRIVDVLMSIPFMFVLILMLVIFGRSIFMLFLGIGLISWLDMARIARGQTLTIKNKEFVEVAHATGVHPLKIILRHIVPNLLGIVIVYATLLVPSMIIFESFISFLGLGVQEPNTSLGALISEGARQMQYGVLWQLYFPIIFFVLTIFSFFFVGDGLRDALDPKDR